MMFERPDDALREIYLRYKENLDAHASWINFFPKLGKEAGPHRDLPADFKPSRVPRSLEAWCRGED